MSIWTSLRDKIVQLLFGYGANKAVEPENTGWVDTREEIKKIALDAAVDVVKDKVLKK